MKKLIFLAFALFATLSAHAFAGKEFYNGLIVEKGDFSFMQEDAKMWFYLDFSKAQKVEYNFKATKVGKEAGLLIDSREKWDEEFEKVYMWTINYWNCACAHRDIPLHMTSEIDSAKYALEIYVDKYGTGHFDMFGGQGATMEGIIMVRNLSTKETVFEARVDRIQTVTGWETFVRRMRALLVGNIIAPYFFNMTPSAYSVMDEPEKWVDWKGNWKTKDREKRITIKTKE